jgi:hypothetical protein
MNTNNKTKTAGTFAAGIIIGALVFGGAGALASSGSRTLTAVYGDIQIYIDKERITPKDVTGKTVEPFAVDGTTYLPIRAISEAFGKEVSWDGGTSSVYIGEQPEAPSETAQAIQLVAGGTYSAPNNGDKRFTPPTGSFVRCDDGSFYEIKRGIDLNSPSGFTSSGKWHPPEALPEATCDWSVYPELELPDVIVNRWKGTYDDGRDSSLSNEYDDLHILNLHEMKRVQYTLYNWIYPETVRYYNEHPDLLKNIRANGYGTEITDLIRQPIHFGDLPHQTQQGFYPWDENEVVKQVKNSPTLRYNIEVWDVYHNGNYLRTEYKMQTSQKPID